MTKTLNSSTESSISTSLIHCIASVGNCEQVHTSVLNLVFQQPKVAGVGNLSQWRSRNLQSLLVCTHNSLKSLLHWGWLNLWLTVQTGISDLDFVQAFHFSPPWMNGAALQSMNSIDAILEDKVLMMTHLDLQKTFPDIPCVSQMLGGPFFAARRYEMNGLNIPLQVLGWGGNDTGRLVTWEFPLRTDSASWKSLETFTQFISFCNSCTLPESSKIVF